MKYYKLNSTFEYDCKTLKVVESIRGCKGCYFYDSTSAVCNNPSTSKLHTRCIRTYRYDGKSIIYQEVKKVSWLKRLKNLLKGK